MGIFNNITNSIFGKNVKEQKPKMAKKSNKRVPNKDAVEKVVIRHEERRERHELIDENERLHQMQAKRRNG